MSRKSLEELPLSASLSYEETTLLAGLLAAFKIIHLLAPPYVEARPAAGPMIDQMLAAMAAIEEGLAPFRRPKP